MDNPQLRDAFRKHYYQRLKQIRQNEKFNAADRSRALKSLILDLFERATEEDNFNFSTTYARVSYAAHKYGIPGKHLFQERKFRTRDLSTLSQEETGKHIFTGFKLVLELVRAMFGGEAPDTWVAYLTEDYPFRYQKPEVKYRFDFLRVVAVDIDQDDKEIIVYEEQRGERTFTIPFAADDLRNELVAQAIAIICKVSSVPVTLNLINAELRHGDRLHPEQIVVNPDYLLDVTAVAESFEANRNYQPWSSLANKLIPRRQELPLIRGNLVNHFLDKLVQDPTLSFRDLLSTIFSIQPLALSLYDDREIRQLISDLKLHYLSVARFVNQELEGIGVKREDIILEPSFLSPTYGVQGRLDVLQAPKKPGERTVIVELKTSSIYKPNKHKINHKNYIQTLLYDLVVNQALGQDANVQSFILYSKFYDDMLRVAPPEHFQKLEAMAARNQLMGVEFLIARLGNDPAEDLEHATRTLIGRLNPANFQSLSKFTARAHERVRATFEQLTGLERRYFGAYLGFIAREQQLSKVGEQGLDATNGLASLWLDTREEKADRFELLDGLRFVAYDTETAVLTLSRPPNDERLVKFRRGDLIALYQTEQEQARRQDPIRHQVHKSSVLTVDATKVSIKLRSHQLNDDNFRGGEFWSIEKDILDSSFRNHYNGLFIWASAEADVRRRWLGLQPPGQPTVMEAADRISSALTDEQDHILRRILRSEDYFLLWGPPGTGKTSQMLHHLVRYLLDQTDESILLVAYTNRAVDEICESIERIRTPAGEPFRNYLRIGSSLGVGEAYRGRLLRAQAAEISRRSQLTDLVGTTRIFVSTVASVGSQGTLFELKQFDRIIVDEASQILEPLLAGLLPRSPKALLIGDHKQLPAVVQQSGRGARVHDEALRELGLTSLSNSLFERLYKKAIAEGWDWAYDRLSHQGRMHKDIMDFPALHFYEGSLHILPDTIAHHRTQVAPLGLTPTANPLTSQLCARRMLFMPVAPDHSTPDVKVNGNEADLVVALIEAFTELYAETGRPIQPDDIGVITPYRAQIAHIRRRLQEGGFSPDDYQVDTVERYQGGAKRIVLISLCTNEPRQLDTLSQLSDEGIDRKLNVAITRAREHLVLLGCPEILRGRQVYADLIDFSA